MNNSPVEPAIISPQNSLTAPLLKALKRHPKRVVYPEGEDIRVLRVAERLVAEQAIAPILLGDKPRIRELAASENINMSFIRIIDPAKSSDLNLFCERYGRIQRMKGFADVDSQSVMTRPQFFASMMVQYGQADAMVAGNQVGAKSVFRAAMRMIKPLPGAKCQFGLMVAIVPEFKQYGNDGMFMLADTSLISLPSVEELANIAVVSGQRAFHLLGRPIRVSLLSSSTRGSNTSPASQRVAAATTLAQSHIAELGQSENIDIVGEMQFDAAMDPDASGIRLGGEVYQPADVVVFPDLDSADILVKMLTLMPDVRLYGTFLAGLALPVVQVPRRVDEERLFGSSLVAGAEAIKFHQVHPGGLADLY